MPFDEKGRYKPIIQLWAELPKKVSKQQYEDNTQNLMSKIETKARQLADQKLSQVQDQCDRQQVVSAVLKFAVDKKKCENSFGEKEYEENCVEYQAMVIHASEVLMPLLI